MRRSGFSLVEVLLVLMVLSFGLLALAGASTAALHRSTTAGLQDQRWAAVQRWGDSLTVRGYGNVTDGSGTLGSISATWTVQSIAADLERVELVVTDNGPEPWQNTVFLHLYR